MLLDRDLYEASPLVERLKAGVQLSRTERKKISGGPLVLCLMDLSFSLRFHDAQMMVQFAEAACSEAVRLPDRRYGEEVAADLRARAWAELGNAYRVADRLTEVGPALSQARYYLLKGSGAPELLARFTELMGSYLVELRRFGDAEQELNLAAELYDEIGSVEGRLRAQVMLGHVLTQAFEPERACIVYLRLFGSIELDSPHLLAVVHGLILNLAEAGHSSMAERLLHRYRPLYRRSGNLMKFRLTWLEGKIAKGLGQFGLAESKLNVAWLAYQRANKIYDSAQVALELAWVYARQHRHQETVWLVDGIIRIFSSLGIAREALLSLALLRKSCLQERSVEVLCGQIEVLLRMIPELRPRSQD